MRHGVKILKFILILFICTFTLISVGECREIVFVVNTSQSMNNSDPLHVVQDSLTWSLENFSADDEVAVIAFKDVPIVIRPLSKVGSSPKNIFNFSYSGRSNPGDALLKAIDMLKQNYGKDRSIIVISNGEISSDDTAKNLKSWETFRACLQQANWLNISVYLVNLRYSDAPQNDYSFSEYATEIPGDYLDLMTTIRTIMHNNFDAPHIELPTNKLTSGILSCEVPIFPSKQMKIFLLSSDVGSVKLKNAQVDVIDERFVKIFKLDSPQTNNFEIELNYPQSTGLTLDVVAEVEGTLQTELRHSVFSENVLEITPVYDDGRQEKIFRNKYFDDKPVRVKVDGKIIKTGINDGVIKVKLDTARDSVVLEKIFFEDLGVIFSGENYAQIKMPDFSFLPWLLATAGVLTILILTYLLRRKNRPQFSKVKGSVPVEKVAKPVDVKKFLVRNKNFSYKGELVIYVTKSPNSEYIPPKVFNLFRTNSSEPISLLKVLRSCDIDFDFPDAQEIIISPSANGVYVENNSSCPFVKSNDLVDKGSFIELCHEDSIDIASIDRTTELIVTYRSLKPT